jgi:hypothetical protein
MKNILLAVVGLSPQVVTETLYALHQQGRPVDAIHLITTRAGKAAILSSLLAPGEGRYFRYLADFGIDLVPIPFVSVRDRIAGELLLEPREPAELMLSLISDELPRLHGLLSQFSGDRRPACHNLRRPSPRHPLRHRAGQGSDPGGAVKKKGATNPGIDSSAHAGRSVSVTWFSKKRGYDYKEDGVKYFPLWEKCAGSVEIIGQGIFIDPDQEFYVY